MPKLRDIIGHDMALSEFERDILSENVAHAYLLSGPAHIGKMTVAHWFAHRLLCDGLDADDEAACTRQYEKLTHADLLVLDDLWMDGENDDWDTIAQTSNVPQQHRAKAKAKTNVISIDDVRALQERLHDTGLGKYRCCLIRSIERMQDAAANAFLKILEEPPAGLVFILTTQAQSQLLPTIVSRCRVLQLRRLPPKDLRPLLSDFTDDEAQLILQIARGAPGTVQLLANDPDALREHKTDYGQARTFWQSSSTTDRFKLLKPLEKRGADADRLLLHLSLTLREQSPPPARVLALHELVRDLRTNAHRPVLIHRFVRSV